MTNKLVVIINSLKVPKIKKILLYEMKFLVANYSCLQNPWLGGYRPQIGLPPPDPRSLCPLFSAEFVEPPPKKIPGYATASGGVFQEKVRIYMYYKTDIVLCSKSLCSLAIYHQSRVMLYFTISSHKVKVKQPLYRPEQALRVLGDWSSQLVTPRSQSLLPPTKYFWHSFPLESESTPRS